MGCALFLGSGGWAKSWFSISTWIAEISLFSGCRSPNLPNGPTMLLSFFSLLLLFVVFFSSYVMIATCGKVLVVTYLISTLTHSKLNNILLRWPTPSGFIPPLCGRCYKASWMPYLLGLGLCRRLKPSLLLLPIDRCHWHSYEPQKLVSDSPDCWFTSSRAVTFHNSWRLPI